MKKNKQSLLLVQKFKIRVPIHAQTYVGPLLRWTFKVSQPLVSSVALYVFPEINTMLKEIIAFANEAWSFISVLYCNVLKLQHLIV